MYSSDEKDICIRHINLLISFVGPNSSWHDLDRSYYLSYDYLVIQITYKTFFNILLTIYEIKLNFQGYETEEKSRQKKQHICTLDGTVDWKGHPAIRRTTGSWFAGLLILGIYISFM